MKKKLIYILIAIMTLSLATGCAYFEDEDTDTTVVKSIESFPESKEGALLGSKNYPAVATEGFTLDGYEGTFDYKVNHVYVSDKCESKLKELGEDLDNYYWDSKCMHILYEVEVSVKELRNGTKKMSLSDIVFSEIYDIDKKTKIKTPDFCNIGIVDLAKKDINQNKIELKVSEDKITLYQLVEMPKGTQEFYSKEYDKDGNPYWIYYIVDNI